VSDIARAFRPDDEALAGIPLGAACVFGLTQLREDGFIGLSESPVVWRTEHRSRARPYVSLPPQAGNTQQPWPSGRDA
jgi:hypothetical protein